MREKFNWIFQESMDWLIIALSILFLFALAYFNHFAADDFFFLHAVKEHSILDITKDIYFNSSGRFLSVLLTSTTTLLMDTVFGLAIFNILGFILLFFAVKYLISYFLTKKKHRIYYSFYFSLIIVFSSFSIGENWFWMSAFFPHTLSFIFLLFVIGISIREARQWQYILGSMAALYIGNSSEIISIISIFAVFVYLVLRLRKKQKINCTVLLFSFFIISGFLINYFSPGTDERKELLANASQIGFFKAFFVSGYITLKKTAVSLFFIIPFSLFIIPFWNRMDEKFKLFTLIKKHIFKIITFYILFVIVYLLPIAYLFHDLGPDRMFLLFSTTTAILVSLFIAFFVRKINLDFIKPILVLTALLYFMIQLNIVKKYSFAYDKQTEILKQGKNTKEEIIIQALPKSGLLYRQNIRDDNRYFVNQFIKEYYQLDGTIVIKNE